LNYFLIKNTALETYIGITQIAFAKAEFNTS